MSIDKIKKHSSIEDVHKRPAKGECLICGVKLRGQVEIENLYYYALDKKVDVCKKHVRL